MIRITTASFAVACVAALNMTDSRCTVNDHWVGQLPYFEPTQEQACSYAGTLPSNTEETHHMFYWMYPNVNPEAPIAVWLNGGPGASSIFANFLMNGPMRIEQTGSGEDDYRMYLYEGGSWADIATMIFVDQPVGTGFSWGDSYLTNMDAAADEFVYFLTQLFTKYPHMVGKDLYLTGESYGGKYLPRYSYALLRANEALESTFFNLKATLAGDPYTAPMTQRTHMHIVPEALNIIDDSNMSQIAAMERKCQEGMTNPNYSTGERGDICSNIMGYITTVGGNVFPYDARIFGSDWDKIEDPTTNYFSISGKVNEIYDLIHVADSTKRPVFEMSSGRVGEAFSDDQLLDYSWYVQELIYRKSPVLIYAGEFDSQDGPKTQEYWLRRMPFDGSPEFWAQSRQIYWVDQPGQTEQIVGGYWRESPYFSYISIPKAGHFVPANNYQPSFSFFSDYIQSRKLNCHNPNGCSVVEDRCALMDNCSSHGTCTSNGQCACDAGWKSADCSLESITLVDGYTAELEQYGPKYYSFTKEGGEHAILQLWSEQPMDVFVSRSSLSDPNQFINDIVFKQTRFVRLYTRDFELLNSDSGFSVTCYSQSFDEMANTFLTNTLKVQYNDYHYGFEAAQDVVSKSIETMSAVG
jgi:vitellogenic carboxypeptidase-like protein